MLQLLLGGSGSGKTTLLYQRIRARAEKGEKSILLVPEQFTSSTEGRIYRELGGCPVRHGGEFFFYQSGRKDPFHRGRRGGADPLLTQAVPCWCARALEELQDNVHYYHRHRRKCGLLPDGGSDHRRG